MKLLFFLIATAAIADPFPAYTIMQDVHRAFEYVKSPGDLKTPDQTRADREGDCADLSLVMIERMGAKGMPGAEISFWDHRWLGSHAVVEYRGRLYDPANDRIWNPGPGWVFRINKNYKGALWLAQGE